MAEYPSLPLWTDAYLGDTMHLKLEEHGAYLKLLIIAWRTPECGLPDDDAKLARMLGVTVERWRDKLRPAIEPFWTVADGRWTQKRLLKEREKVQNFSEVQRDRARKRWPAKSLNGHDPGDAGAKPARGNAIPSPSPSKEVIESTGDKTETVTTPTPPADAGRGARAVLWSEVKAFLGGTNPGAVIGKLCRDYGEGAFIEAYFAARREGPADPTSRIAGMLKARSRKAGGMGIADKIRAQLAAEGITLQ
jgi:uncharacterized protein YdaU (DUF1376 family)